MLATVKLLTTTNAANSNSPSLSKQTNFTYLTQQYVFKPVMRYFANALLNQ